MRVLILLTLTALASLASAGQPEKYIDVQHDAHRGVTCWILNDKAISCLPDSQLSPQAQVGAERSTCAKSLVSNPPARQHDEVVDL